MTEFNWFDERNKFYLKRANSFLEKTEDRLASADKSNIEEIRFANRSVERAKETIALFEAAIKAGNTEEGRAKEQEGIEKIFGWLSDYEMSEYAGKYFSDRPKP